MDETEKNIEIARGQLEKELRAAIDEAVDPKLMLDPWKRMRETIDRLELLERAEWLLPVQS